MLRRQGASRSLVKSEPQSHPLSLALFIVSFLLASFVVWHYMEWEPNELSYIFAAGLSLVAIRDFVDHIKRECCSKPRELTPEEQQRQFEREVDEEVKLLQEEEAMRRQREQELRERASMLYYGTPYGTPSPKCSRSKTMPSNLIRQTLEAGEASQQASQQAGAVVGMADTKVQAAVGTLRPPTGVTSPSRPPRPPPRTPSATSFSTSSADSPTSAASATYAPAPAKRPSLEAAQQTPARGPPARIRLSPPVTLPAPRNPPPLSRPPAGSTQTPQAPQRRPLPRSATAGVAPPGRARPSAPRSAQRAL